MRTNLRKLKISDFRWILGFFGIFAISSICGAYGKNCRLGWQELSRVAQGRPLDLGGSFGYCLIRFQDVSEVVSRKSGTTDKLNLSFWIFLNFRNFEDFKV